MEGKNSITRKGIKEYSAVKRDIFRYDGLTNLPLGFGGMQYDSLKSSYFNYVERSMSELSNAYLSSGMARRIVDLLPFEMVREWIDFTSESVDAKDIQEQIRDKIFAYQVNNARRIMQSHPEIAQEMRKLKVRETFQNAMRLARLFGSSIIVIGIKDGLPLSEPVREKHILGVEYLKIFDKRQILIEECKSDLSGDYCVIRADSGRKVIIHRSRLMVFSGDMNINSTNIYDGVSVLQGVYQELLNYGLMYDTTASLVKDSRIAIMKVRDFAKIASGGGDKISKRLLHMDMTRSVQNTIMLDAGNEDYQYLSSNFSGLADLLDRYAYQISSITGIPVSKLLGTPPKGFNANGEEDIRNFYDEIRSKQMIFLLPALERLVGYIAIAKRRPAPSINFLPLWQMKSTDEGEALLKKAKAMAICNQIINETIGKKKSEKAKDIK